MIFVDDCVKQCYTETVAAGGRGRRAARSDAVPRKLTNFRLEPELLAEIQEARHALAKPTLSDLVRDALRRYLDENSRAIRSYRRLRKRQISR